MPVLTTHARLCGSAALLGVLACRTPEPPGGAPPRDAPATDPSLATNPTGEAQPVADAPPAPVAPAPDGEAEPPPDLLTFARGAIPLRARGHAGPGAAGIDEALAAIDGAATPYSMARQAPADAVTEFVYELPAPTTFTRLAIPEVVEVPSKFTTFTRDVAVHGSATSADDGFVLLASTTLTTHAGRGELSELPIQTKTPVRWLRLTLTGGISLEDTPATLQFSELLGYGAQEPAPLLTRFDGAWRTRGANYDLRQEGALVTGCFDDVGELDGSVTGNILRARGVATATGVVSLFVLTVMPDGELRGVRSTNGAPFRLVSSAAAPKSAPTKCPRLAPPKLGCGAVIHGLQFAFDSAELRPDAAPILDRLRDGLADGAAAVVIEGHTSSEGKDRYNRDLSRRRAEAVVDALVGRGIARERLSASGRGPDAPIASNDDDAGRSLNRRVEVHCR